MQNTPTDKKIARDKRNEEIFTLYTDGNLSIEDLHEKFGLSIVYISGILTKRGVKKRKKTI
jgi:Mor family transcriptional regulator